MLYIIFSVVTRYRVCVVVVVVVLCGGAVVLMCWDHSLATANKNSCFKLLVLREQTFTFNFNFSIYCLSAILFRTEEKRHHTATTNMTHAPPPPPPPPPPAPCPAVTPSTLNVAVEGCCHGELDIIYDTIRESERKQNMKVDLLLVCGDFECVRNMSDLDCVAVPQKYKKMVRWLQRTLCY